MTSFDVDAQKQIVEIRRLKAKGYSDVEIINFMGLEKRTFYNRKAKMREEMWDAIKSLDKASVMEDINMARVRLEDCLKRIELRLDRPQPELTVGQLDTLIARKSELAMHLAMLQHDAVRVLTRVDNYGEYSEINDGNTGKGIEEQPTTG